MDVPKKNWGPVNGSRSEMRLEMTSAFTKKKMPAERLSAESAQSKIVGVSEALGECPTDGKSSVRMPETKRIPSTSGSEITNRLA